jgi:hypothetical protein
MRRPVWPLPVALLVVLVTTVVPAAVTEILAPPFLIPIGWEVGLTIGHDGTEWGLDCFSGQWRWGTEPGAWTPDPPHRQTDSTFLRMCDCVGTHEFKGGAYEETYPGDVENPPQYAWSYLTKEFGVAGPDRDAYYGPQDYVAWSEGPPLFMEADVLFYLYSGTLPIGQNVSGEAQERIRPYSQWGIVGQWSDWAGPDAGMFELIGEMIYDFKTLQVNNQQWWDSQPIGTVIQEFDQQNRVTLTNCDGIPQTFTFGVRHFRMEKIGAASCRLYDVP